MAIQKGRTSSANPTSKLNVGAQAPDVELDSHLGTKVRLRDFRDKQNVVLVFYPFAFTGV